MIEITTPQGPFKVWTRRVGNNPRIKLLLLHGGPGFPHEYFEAFDDYLLREGIEYIYYDQLGSYYSDQPEMTDEMLALPRFVDEVEQVRRALDLDSDNFYLFGQSWGGLLAIEYALKHQDHLKALVISNMMASIPQYNDYAANVLMPAMDPKVLAEVQQLEADGKYEDPRYLELLIPNHYEQHVIRMPMNQWPDPLKRAFDHMNPKSTYRCRDPASWAPAAGSRTGTAPPTSRTSRCARWSSERASTRWTRGIWNGWRTSYRAGSTCIARTAATWPCTTTKAPTCAA